MKPSQEQLLRMVLSAYPKDFLQPDALEHPESCGDDLFRFLVEELSETYDPDDPVGTAVDIVNKAIADLEAVQRVLEESLPDEAA